LKYRKPRPIPEKTSRELLQIIAKDKILKKWELKAENYHILIDAKNVSKVKKRLEDYGAPHPS